MTTEPKIAYCTNVHAGTTFEEILATLQNYSCAVRENVCKGSELGVGLWLSSSVARELDDADRVAELGEFLKAKGLNPFTFNGFPYGDFHSPVVKHDVYKPTWADPERLDYTLRLARIQSGLLPADSKGTISTLPIGWPTSKNRLSHEDHEQIRKVSAAQLIKLAIGLEELADANGNEISVHLEPEPGCLILNSAGTTEFFDYLFEQAGSKREMVRRFIGVCHDICHSAVMFENQRDAIRGYVEAGIRIGKVQVSSAIEVDFASLNPEQVAKALEQLTEFAEERYLHQTVVSDGSFIAFHEDLPLALEKFKDEPQNKWRIHFHVPIHQERIGLLGTTQFDIEPCVKAVRELSPETVHFEIETYAWNVMPAGALELELTESISAEWKWFENLVQNLS